MNFLVIFMKNKNLKQIDLLKDFLKGLIGCSFKIDCGKEIVISYDKNDDIDFKEIANIINNELFINITLLECFVDKEYLNELIDLYNKLEYKSMLYLNEKELLKLSNKCCNEIIRKNILKKFYNDNEMLNVIKVFLECNLNTSVAAGKLYLHRNTLINKIDKFISVTGYDVKNFEEACIIYNLI